MRDRWHRQPTWLRWTVGLLYALTFYVGINVFMGVDSIPAAVRWVGLLVAMAVAFGLAFFVGGRRLGGRGQIRLMRRSIKAGTVLPGADRERWRVEVPRQARYLREYRRFSVVVFFVLTAFLVVIEVVAAIAGELLLGLVTVAPALLMLGPLAWTVFRWMPRRRDRVEALQRELLAEADPWPDRPTAESPS